MKIQQRTGKIIMDDVEVFRKSDDASIKGLDLEDEDMVEFIYGERVK
jgi:hypothetical protein